ncbi:MAG: hypothetical protein GTN81_04285 [Proteobacteria bacterium]|nr:hypothetical protein [Pseudomonadota bacterium]
MLSFFDTDIWFFPLVRRNVYGVRVEDVLKRVDELMLPEAEKKGLKLKLHLEHLWQ